MDEVFHLTASEFVRVRGRDPGALEVEGNWGPHGSPPPKHFHPDQDERFEMLAGRLRVRVDGQESELGPGEVLKIPRRSVHQMWNPGDEPARALWRTSPAGRTYEWFAAISAAREQSQRDPGPLAFGAYLTEYADVFRLAGPQPLLRPVLAVLGAAGRLKGHKPVR